MSKAQICDFCESTIMEKFSDKSYKVVEVKHAYDGYAPFLHRWTVDICPDCMTDLTQNLNEFRRESSTPSPAGKKG